MFHLIVSTLTVAALSACVTPSGPPTSWVMTDTLSNANTPNFSSGQARTVVFFSNISWQSGNPRAPYFAQGWMDDVLVGNPYAFQIRIDGGQLLNGGLILKDVATGQEIAATQARVNSSFNCGPLTGQIPRPSSSVQCYWNPGQTGFIQRPQLPTNKSSYSLELVPSCRGKLMYTDMRCPAQVGGNPDGAQASTDVVTILTISPPISPSIPLHGQKFEYELLSRTSVGQTSTHITAVYVAPGQCHIDNMLSNPNSGKVGDRISIEWFIRDCHQAEVKTNDTAVPTLYFRKTSSDDIASAPDFNDSRPYVLPKQTNITFTANAVDAMGRSTSRKVTTTVDPCSISLTHPQCPTRCQASPPPSGCPLPPQPQCPIGEGDANRQQKQFNFEVLCSFGGGTAQTQPASEWACTEAEAKQSVNNRAGIGCAVVQSTGAWVSPDGSATTGPECSGGATKTEWKFCLACSSQSGPIYTTETRQACFLPDAVNAASANRPTQNCWLQNQGDCP